MPTPDDGRIRTATTFQQRYPYFDNPFAILLALIALCIAKGLLGPGPIRVYTHDSWMFLDGAWRILNGQRPHRDFYSNLGFLCYLPTVLGLEFSRGASAVNWGQCFSGIAVSLLSVSLVFHRLRPPFSALYCTALTLLTIAPFSLGEFFTMGTQAVTYNRLGYALLAILLVECVCPIRAEKPTQSQVGGGLIAGAIVGLAFFLKFTLAIFALALIVGTIQERPQSRARWLGLVSAALVVGIAGLAFLHFDMAAILHDVRIIKVGRAAGLLSFVARPLQNLPRLASLCAFVSVAALAFRYFGASNSAGRWTWIFLVTLGIDVAVLGTNTFHQTTDFPLSALAILVILADIDKMVPAAESFRVVRSALVVFGLSIALVNPVLDAAGFLCDAVRSAIQPKQFATARIISPARDDVVTTEFLNPATGANSLVEEANDGIALLQQQSKPAERIGAFWFANPFSYWLQRAPMKGGSPCWDYGGNFNDKSGPAPEEAFGGADVILVPRVNEDGLGWTGQSQLSRVYGTFLESNFRKVAESRYWWLYRKSERVNSGGQL